MAEETISTNMQRDNGNPSNPASSSGETLPVLPINLVQALIADKDALLTLTNAISAANEPLRQHHAVYENEQPAVPEGQPGRSSVLYPSVARGVASESTQKRVSEELSDDSLEIIRAVKRPRIEICDHDELEESDLIAAPNARWDASESLKELIDASIQPLKRFERRAIKKEFPRPNIDAAYTPNLDSYLVPLIPGIKAPDETLRDLHDKICDVFGPLGVMYENFLPLVEAINHQGEVTLDHPTLAAFINCLKKSVLLVGDASASLTTRRRE